MESRRFDSELQDLLQLSRDALGALSRLRESDAERQITATEAEDYDRIAARVEQILNLGSARYSGIDFSTTTTKLIEHLEMVLTDLHHEALRRFSSELSSLRPFLQEQGRSKEQIEKMIREAKGGGGGGGGGSWMPLAGLAAAALAIVLAIVAFFLPAGTGSGDGVPIGTILPFFGTPDQVPEGYLLCDGRQHAQPNFPELYAHIEAARPGWVDEPDVFQLPDLRGEFLRGLDVNRGIDPGRELGSVQLDSMIVHTHQYTKTILGAEGWSVGSGQSFVDYDNGTQSGPPVVEGDMDRISNETRPRNVAVAYIIKAR